MQETVQALGAFVTIVGLMVVAPFEAGRVPPAVWHTITRALNRSRGWLSRWLPFLRRDLTHSIGSASAITSAVTVSAFGRSGVTDKGTTKQQLAAIRAALTSIHGELDGLRAEDIAIRAEMTAKFRQLSEDHLATRQALEEQKREQGALNARGVPLAAVGALLTGVPGSWVAAGGWWLTVSLLLVGLVAAGVALHGLWKKRHKLALGLHSFRPPAQQTG
jgi:hypothetical protein